MSRLWYIWDRGLVRNDDIGRVFGVSYLAVRHILKDVKERMKRDAQFGRKGQSNKSQFKM